MKTQFSLPAIGSRIAVTVEFPSYVIGQKVNKTTITGVVEKASKFTPPNFIRLITDFDSPVRVREIPLHKITKLEYADGTQASMENISDNARTWTVNGSKGNVYTVIKTETNWTCTCPGYQFRKTCRHIKELQHA